MTEQQTITPVDHALEVETLRTVIMGNLTELSTLLDLTGDLVHGHQRGLGFLTADGREVLDDLMRRERADRLEHAKQGIKASGASPAPGNITAWATNAEIHVELAGIHHQVMRRLHTAGVCLAWRTPRDPNPLVLMARLAVLISHTTNTGVLTDTDRALQSLVDRATRLVDGNDTKLHPDNCPHCGRRTLVVYFDPGVIRCEPGKDDKPCICRDSYCPCKRKRHLHEWHRDKGTATNSWWHLSDELNRIRRAKEPQA